MLFNSADFLIFLPIVLISYWMLVGKKIVFQNILLLISSYIFYGWWDWRFLSLIAFSTVVDYFAGLGIYQSQTQQKRKQYLLLSICTNLGLLGFFKYYNFFIDSWVTAFASLGVAFHPWSLQIILPVGISFYTFQTLSYSIDIYRNRITPTKDFISFAAFVSFFPQLVAGPIERASNLLPQFEKTRVFDYNQAINGLMLIVYGFFKKIVIADRLAIYVDSVFADVAHANSISLILAIIFFSFQIYCDFSGYSLIARGTAKLFGFELMVNFKRPYLSQSIPDFWRNWHISLSTWFKDYVYIPLGGNRVSSSRNYINLMVVFLVSGLWHGANWTFVVWGALHGMYQIIYVGLKKIGVRIQTTSIILTSFNILFVYSLVCFAWIFFRAETVTDAFLYIQKLFEWDFSLNLVQISAEKGPFNLLLSFLSIGLLGLSYLLPQNLTFKKEEYYLILMMVMFISIILLGVNGNNTFIYFQF